MAAAAKRSSLAPLSPEQAAARSDRLLSNMHHVYSHDLPNQMVALQSLLQLLSLEESANLSDDGREYVRRLQNVARRANELIRFLKEMGRLKTFTCKIETIALGNLAREVQGELQRRLPDKKLEFDWHWQAPTVVGDVRVYVRAIGELCSSLVAGPGDAWRVHATSRERPEATELAFRVEASTAAPETQDRAATTVERLQAMLAREWLALCGAELVAAPQAGPEVSFLIVAPNQ